MHLSFEEPGDLFAYLEMMQAIADDYMNDHPEVTPESLSPPNCFYLNLDGLLIVGEAIDSEYEEDRIPVMESRKRGYILGRWYSLVCPDGELGSYHISRVKPLSRDGFDKALNKLHDINMKES